jgi:hypothetical protein
VVATFAPYAFDPPAVQWTKNFAGVGNAIGYHVEQTNDGGYVVAGITYAGPDIKLLLVKTDSYGDAVWTKTMGIGGFQPTRAFMVHQTVDGGYIVGVNGVLTAQARADIWLVKLDGQGNIVWQNEISSDVFPYAYVSGHALVQTSDGGYAVVAIETLSDSAVVLFKTDNLGRRQWLKRYAVAIRQLGVPDRISLRQTSDGGYIIGTRTLLKVDSQGDQQWLRTFSDVVCANSVLQSPDGGYVATGQARHYSRSSIYLFKTNADGFREWIVELASSSRSEGRWVERTADGGFVVAGNCRSPEKRTKASILRTTSSGTLVWTDLLCNGGAECARQTQDGGYIVTGLYYVPASQYGTSYLFLTKLAPDRKR